MRYISTRGRAMPIGFNEALLSGLASDGGLFMPERWPTLRADQRSMVSKLEFAEVASIILSPFVDGEIASDDLLQMARDAYASFEHPQVTPLVQISDTDWILELFHGPTLAFKDVAMQFLAKLYGHVLRETGQHKTIIGATSGDTGGAAIEAFAGIRGVDIFMLHPKGRISEVQRRIMTTVDADNVVNIAVDGSFDDCQRIVKTLFTDENVSKRKNLGGVNSINWVRLAIQAVYYFTSAKEIPGASYVVPTGNFGDIFAGYVAKNMGANIDKLAVAVNENDIMDRVLRTGIYLPSATVQTQSPSMDIQVASNFERLLFEKTGRDSAGLNELMRNFEHTGSMDLPANLLSAISDDFISAKANEAAVSVKIAAIFEKHGMLIDPHTAVGLVVNDALRKEGKLTGNVITLATAHPAKFPDAVFAAAGTMPTLPTRYSNLFSLKERQLTAPNDIASIAKIILTHESLPA